jgi:thioredoxin-related protein
MGYIFIILLVLTLVIWHLMCKPVYLFHRDTCPHCVRMKGEWKKFKNRCTFSMIKPIEIDISDDANKDICDKYNVKSVPTIIKLDNGMPIIYDGERLSTDIYNWASN